MNILITGGAGFLGSNLAEHYLKKGHNICIIDNFATGKKNFIEKFKQIEFVLGTIADKKLIEKIFTKFKPTHVIHSAASYKDPNNWEEDVLTNILGLVNLIKSSEDHNIKRFINFQTSLIYGKPKTLPIPLNHHREPFTSYGISKNSAEDYLLLSKLNFISLRLATVCGPRLSVGPIPTFYKRLKSNLECFCSDAIREYMDISDFFNLIDIIIDNNTKGFFNASPGKGFSILEVFNEVAKYLGIKVDKVPVIPVEDDDVKQVILDPSETIKIFKWKTKVSFSNIIINQLKWYDRDGIDNIYSHLKKPNYINKNDIFE